MTAFSKCLSTQDVIAVSSQHTSSNVPIHCGGVLKSLCQHAVEVRVELHQHELCLTEFFYLLYFSNYSSVEGVLKTLVKTCRP